MSTDWPWLLVLALVIPPALGHLYHFVLVINVGSGLGLREPTMDKIRDVLFVALAIRRWCSALDASPYPLVELGVAALVLCHGCAWSRARSSRRSTRSRIVRRRRPAGIAGRSEALDLASRDGHDALIGPGRRSWLLRLPRNESFRLQLREWDLTVPDLPEPLDGLRIVQFSDLHIAPCFERRFFEAVVEACLDWQADLVVMTGDLVEDDDTIAWVEPLLAPLEARLGKFAILGNHDNEHQPRTITGELGRAGFEMLEGRWTTLDVDGTVLAIGGTSEPWGPGLSTSDLPAADFRFLLSHSPDLFYKAQRWGVEPDALRPQPRRARSGSRSLGRSSCPAAIRGDSTAGSSGKMGRCFM